jgi:tryptophan 2,3-dioxygenase
MRNMCRWEQRNVAALSRLIEKTKRWTEGRDGRDYVRGLSKGTLRE